MEATIESHTTKVRYNVTRAKAVIITHIGGSEIEYHSGMAAAKATGIPQTEISKMCRLGIEYRGVKARFK